MKDYTPNKKPLNYFERQKQRLHTKKYRFYFFDYLYYKGEKWSEKSLRSSGMIVLLFFWIWNVVLPLLIVLPEKLIGMDNLYTGIALSLFPILFSILRYRKDRRAAVMQHYKHIKNSGLSLILLFAGSFGIFFIEIWLLKTLGFDGGTIKIF